MLDKKRVIFYLISFIFLVSAVNSVNFDLELDRPNFTYGEIFIFSVNTSFPIQNVSQINYTLSLEDKYIFNDFLNFTNFTLESDSVNWELNNVDTNLSYLYEIELYLNNSLDISSFNEINLNLSYLLENGTLVNTTETINTFTVIEPNIDLNVDLVSESLSAGDLFNLSISFTNISNSPVNLILRNSFPLGLNYINSSLTPNFVNNSLLEFTFENSSEVEDFDIEFQVNSSEVLSDDILIIFNELNYSSFDSLFARNYFSNQLQNIRIGSANFSLSFIPQLLFIGQEFNITALLNFSSAGGKNVSLINELPSGVEFVSSDPSFSSQLNGNQLTLNLFNVTGPDLIEINLTYRTNQSLLANSVLDFNYSFIYQSSDNSEYISNETINFNSEDITDLNIQPNISQVLHGDLFEFNLNANFTRVSGKNVSLSQSFPEGVDFIQINSSLLEDSINISNSTIQINYQDIISSNLNITILYSLNNSFNDSNVNLNTNFSYLNNQNNITQVSQSDLISVLEPRIDITKNIVESQVFINDNLTYEFTIRNNGDSPAYNISLNETISDGTLFDSSSTNFTVNGLNSEILSLEIPFLDVGNQLTYSITVNITENYFNGSEILSNDELNFDTNLVYFNREISELNKKKFNSSTQSSTLISPPSFSVDIISSISNITDANVSAVRIGEEFDYNVRLNFSNAPARNITLISLIPDNFAFVSQSNNFNGSSFSVNSNLINWNIQELNRTKPFLEINLTLRLNEIPQNNKGDSIQTDFNLSYENSQTEQDLILDSSEPIFIVEPVLNVSRSISNENTNLFVNQLTSYNISIFNIFNSSNTSDQYNSDAYDIFLTERIPDGLSYNNSNFNPSLVNSTHVIWNFSRLDLGDEILVNLTLYVNSTYENNSLIYADTEFENSREINYSSFNDSINSRTYFSQYQSPNLSISNPVLRIRNIASSFSIGDFIDYQIELDFSSAPANGITFDAIIDPNLVIDNSSFSVSFNNLTFNMSGNNLSWTFEDMINAQIIEVNLTTVIFGTLERNDIVNFIGNITYLNYLDELSFVNYVDDLIVTEPELFIVPEIDIDIPSNEIINYTLNIENRETSNSHYTQFYHTIPNGTSFVSVSPLYDSIFGDNNESIYFDLGLIPSLETVQVNITLNVSDIYLDGDYLRGGDRLNFYSNFTYNSSSIPDFSRTYFGEHTFFSYVYRPILSTQILTEENFDGIPAIKFGEIFNYTISVDPRNAPSDFVNVTTTMPAGVDFISQNNSFPPTIFTSLGNKSYLWEFGNLTKSNEEIQINVTAILRNDSSYTSSDIIDTTFRVSFRNITEQQVFRENVRSMGVIENNIQIGNILLTPQTQNFSVNDIVTYRLYINNTFNEDNYLNSTAYNLSIINNIPDGLVYENSTLSFENRSNTMVEWYIDRLDTNHEAFIDVSFRINETYLNGTPINTRDIFQNNFELSVNSVPDQTRAKQYFFTANSTTIQMNSPTLLVQLNETELSIGEKINLSYILNFSSVISSDFGLELQIPFGLEYVSFNNLDYTNFSIQNQTLYWNFKNQTQRKQYLLNVTLITNNSLNRDDIIDFNSNLTYSSLTDNITYNITNTSNITIIEPQIQVLVDSIPRNKVGDDFIHNITIINQGNSPARNVTSNIILADGLNYTNSNFSQGSLSILSPNVLRYSFIDLNPGENISLQINTTIIPQYFSNDYVLAGDTLVSEINSTYYSSYNYTFAREYNIFNSSQVSVINPDLIIDTNITRQILGNDLIDIGDVFEYNIEINLTDKPSTTLNLMADFAENFEYISYTSSLGSSSIDFNVVGDNFIWNLTSISPLEELVTIDLQLYLTNQTTLTFGDQIENLFILEYANSSGVFNSTQQTNNLSLSEPNIDINLNSNMSFIDIDDIFTYNVTISNLNRTPDYSSQANNLDLIIDFSDGLSFVSSNITTDFQNSEQARFSFNNLPVDDLIQFEVTLLVEEFLRSGSYNNLDFFISNITLSYTSDENVSSSRLYTLQDTQSTPRVDRIPPQISSSLITPNIVPRNWPVQLEMNATDNIELNSCFGEVVYPDNSTSPIINNLCSGNSFSSTTDIGIYEVIFFADDTSGNEANFSNSFEVKEAVSFNSSIVDFEFNPLTANIRTTIQDQEHDFSSLVSGIYSIDVTNDLYDIEYSLYNNRFVVKLNDINLSSQNNETIGFDRYLNITNEFVVYSVENNYNFTSDADIWIYYDNLPFINNTLFNLEVCEDWNFNSRECNSTWDNLSSSASLNSNLSFVSFSRSSFSGFRISSSDATFVGIPNTTPPPSSNPPGGGGGGGAGSNTQPSFNSGDDLDNYDSQINNLTDNDNLPSSDSPERLDDQDNNLTEELDLEVLEGSLDNKINDSELTSENPLLSFIKGIKINYTLLFLLLVYLILLVPVYKINLLLKNNLRKEIVLIKRRKMNYYGKRNFFNLETLYNLRRILPLLEVMIIFSTLILILFLGWTLGLILGIIAQVLIYLILRYQVKIGKDKFIF